MLVKSVTVEKSSVQHSLSLHRMRKQAMHLDDSYKDRYLNHCSCSLALHEILINVDFPVYNMKEHLA